MNSFEDMFKAMLAGKKRPVIRTIPMKPEQKIFATHEVIRWGLEHYYVRANRTKEQCHHDGLIRRLTDEEKTLRGFTTREGVYEWVQPG